MNQLDYEQSLIKANNYFLQEKYNLFLSEFAKCYEYNSECFSDPTNVFKFSFSNYSLNNNNTINEYNRFILHLNKYLNTIKDDKEKDIFIVKIKDMTNKKYNEVCAYNKVIYYHDFNSFCVLVSQLYDLTDKCIKENLIKDKEIINTFISDIEKKIDELFKVIRWTAARYKIHFVFLPKKPKEFLKELKLNVTKLKEQLI